MPRLSRIFSTVNWKYALGELVLIVMGVTIALIATSWYEDRAARTRELDLLREARSALETDYLVLNGYREQTAERIEKLEQLVAHLESDAPYNDSLPGLFRWLNGWRGVRIRTAPFEALKELGLDLISNSEIRTKLVSLYEDSYASLERSADNDQSFVVDHSLPYFLGNFHRTSAMTWVPHDYDGIRQSGTVVNLARWRINTISTFQLSAYQQTLDTMEEVIALIDEELGVDRASN